jgi:hypothetical protein
MSSPPTPSDMPNSIQPSPSPTPPPQQ